MGVDEASLPDGFCAHEVGRAHKDTPFEAARLAMLSTGLGDVAKALGDYDDAFRWCGHAGCSSFCVLSNQAGEIMLLDEGQGADGCIRLPADRRLDEQS